MNNKSIILQHLHSLISKNVLGEKQYISRYKGFVGELAFFELLDSKLSIRKTYNGGFFLPIEKQNSSLQNPVYFTVSSSEPDDYIKIYNTISKIGCSHMFFIKWADHSPVESWNMVDVMGFNLPMPVPPIITYLFDFHLNCFQVCELSTLLDLYPDRVRKNSIGEKIQELVKNEFIDKLARFESKHLLDLYVQRLLFDGFIGYGKTHGIPADIDLIMDSKNLHEILFLEIKEKDLSKRAPKGFGMDVDRIKSIRTLSLMTGTQVYYIVRQVNNQKERLFIKWRYINMFNFVSCLDDAVIEGGAGMGYENGSYPTQICPEQHFGTL
jgi:hypothetical protein